MDRKSIIVLVISFALLMAWYPLVRHFYPPPPPGTQTTQTSTNAAAAATNAATPAAPQKPAPSPAVPAQPVQFSGPETTAVLESPVARFTFTSHGGGIRRVELKGFPENVSCSKAADNATNFASLNQSAPVAAFTLGGAAMLQDAAPFTLTKTTTGVRAEKQLTNGLVLIKDFQTTSNYLLSATLRLENRGSAPVTLPSHELVVGTATPLTAHDDGTKMGFMWFNGTKSEIVREDWFANRALGCIPSTPRRDYLGPVSATNAWAAVFNQFYTMIAMPNHVAQQVVSHRLELPPPSRETLAQDPKAVAAPFAYQTAFAYPATVIAPGAKLERQVTYFIGPKEYNNLARLGSAFQNGIDRIMEFDGFFGFFAKALLLCMNALHQFGLPYGAAIIAITVFIKLVFWPLTNHSTRSMKRMAALQPQMKALQEKYKDDPKKMNLKLMEFMKENKVSPMAGCIPMVLQIPVFFGFYTMLQSAIELRGAKFLWACDLSQSDTVAVIPGLQFPVNPMPLLMGVTMIIQARLTPPSPGMDPAQQKIMKYMPLMFMVFLYNFSAGLTLYWTVQNLLTILQMKVTKANEDKNTGAAKPAAPAKKS
jgi:YidC/Oxa1 family membrane protein insertase